MAASLGGSPRQSTVPRVRPPSLPFPGGLWDAPAVLQMDAIERTLHASWRHRVFFTDHVFDPSNPVLCDTLASQGFSGPGKNLVVLDANLTATRPGLSAQIANYFAAHRETLCLVAEPIIEPGGEAAKNSWAPVSSLHQAVECHHLDRHSYLVAAGGGALLDLAGLAAATAHRGVRHVRVPPTTLSQCDAGVGIKNGINAFGKKNFIGTFCPPWAVLNDFQMLATLAPADKRAGYAEAVKVACLRDPAFFESLERDALPLRQFEAPAMRTLIRRCAELHVDHIARRDDPFESGSSRPLDFGHWAAHKLEQLSNFRLRHGEAVAIGIALDVVYSRRQGHLDATGAERVLRLLEVLGFDLFATEMLHGEQDGTWVLLQGLEEFRENLGGRLAITLLNAIGSCFETHVMSAALIIEAIHELQARHASQPSRGEPGLP